MLVKHIEVKPPTSRHDWLPWSWCNLRRNPFGELLREERVQVAVVDVSEIASHVRELRTAVQLIGDCGRGKTTRMLVLAEALDDSAYVYLPEDEPCPAIPAGTPLLIDEAQRLPRAVRRRVLASGLPLVLATHRNLRRPLARAGYQVQTYQIGSTNDAALVAKLLNRRIEASRLSPQGEVPRMTARTLRFWLSVLAATFGRSRVTCTKWFKPKFLAMAKCDLSIQLDDPKTVQPGGGKITGVVRVNADKDVNCKGLEVSTVWKTHGRGNVATGTCDTQTVYSGEWRAGEQAEYRFELQIGDWPPSYHGHYLSVDHYVDARAKIPWGFDPKASEPFLMRPTCGPEGAVVSSNARELSGPIGCIIGAIFMAVFVGFGIAMLAAVGAFALLFIVPIGLIGGAIWFFKYFLPKFALGNVACDLEQSTVAPGAKINGALTIRPKRNVSINGITMKLEAREEVVSGSGSNRTTHRNVFLEKEQTLQGESVLQAGVEHRFPLDVVLPGDAPFSVDLSDNDLIWHAKVRVDIPRWPDWTKDLKIIVAPSGEALPPPEPAKTPVAVTPAAESTADAGITFAETAQHIWAVRADVDQVETLVAAVSGLTFQVEAFVERRLLYSGDEDPHVYEDGYAVWAHHTEPPLPLVLYVPHELADEFEQIGRDLWRGRGTIVGWDHSHRRLQIKLERPGG